jgi:hypothetical protein
LPEVSLPPLHAAMTVTAVTARIDRAGARRAVRVECFK